MFLVLVVVSIRVLYVTPNNDFFFISFLDSSVNSDAGALKFSVSVSAFELMPCYFFATYFFLIRFLYEIPFNAIFFFYFLVSGVSNRFVVLILS